MLDGESLGRDAALNKTWIGKIWAAKFTKTLHGLTVPAGPEC